MKKYMLPVILCCFFLSCKNTWDDDDKQTFYQSCIDAAKSDGNSEAKAKPYCDCLMEKMMKRYPNESDALEHMDTVITDPEMQKCKDLLK
jgi:hypothetical protein